MRTLLTIFIIFSVYLYSLGLGVNKFYYGSDCSSTSSDKSIGIIHFKSFDSTNYDFVKMDACNWGSLGVFVDKPIGISSGTFTYEFDEVNYDILHHVQNSFNYLTMDSYFCEIKDSTDSEALGFIFVANDFVADSLSLESSSLTVLNNTLEAHNNSSTHSLTYTSSPEQTGASQDAYLVSFSETNNYESTYSPSELLYPLYFDDGNNWLELILDTDRSNEIVGFKYYSDLNSNTYTKFIKPNN